ncbi:Ig-like domain-containing protein [Rubritalea sp.]|uniref:Ig-like domain-containing protein n=1 Tax=Rubritalea sp. TaxID=2109375 RepID=UPI003EF45479
MKPTHLLTCALMSALTPLTQAEILVAYDFNATATDLSAATIVANKIIASQISSPMDIAFVTTAGDNSGLDADGNSLGDPNTNGSIGIQVIDATTSSFENALAGDDYIAFTVTPELGQKLNLTSLSFKVGMKAATSVDEYALTDASGNLIGSPELITTVVTSGIGTYQSVSIDLSDPQYQNLTEETTFRLYAWGRETTNTASTIAFVDKVVLNGSVESTLLVGYDFDSTATDPSDVTFLASNLTASALTSPMDIAFVDTASDNTGVDAFGADFGSTTSVGAVGIQVTDATRTSFELAVESDHYVAFTLTPNQGSGLQVNGLSFKATKKAETSVDEYAITDAAGNLVAGPFAISNVVGLTGVYDGLTANLTGTDFEYLTEATEFRIYAWGRGTNKTANTLAAIDKITVHGNTFAMGSDFYVAANGNDSNSGSVGQPLASIQQAIDNSGPGSTIYLRGGNYHQEVDLSGVAGIAGHPITITPYNGETVTFDGTKPITTNWTLDEGNVYKTTLTEDVTQLFVDDQIMTLARFPNALVWSDEMWHARTSKQSGSTRGYIVGADAIGDAGVSFEGCIGMFNFGNFETIISRVSSHTSGANEFNYSPSAGIYRHSDEYFFEGGVDNAERAILDIAQEWAYDESTKTLYLWADDGLNPNGRSISGKVQKFAITGDASTQNIVLDGLDFHATAFKFTSSDGITIQNCDLRYHTASDRALGSIEAPEPAQVSGTTDDYCEDLLVYNNTFRYSDTAALVCSYLQDPVVENNLFRDVNYTCVISTAVQTSQAQNLVLRRNTLINSGPFAGFRFGRNKEDESFEPFILEHNYTEKCSRLQEDGTAFYSALGGLAGSVWRHNWAYDNYEIDYRFDGANTPLEGVEANFYRNVAMATTTKQVNQIGAAYKLKGDYHEIYNNIAVHGRADFEVSIEKGGNENSFTSNNAGDKLVGNDGGSAVPGTASNNYAAQNEPRRMLDILRDPYNFDFRPKADAVEFVDQGKTIICDINGESVDLTAGYYGAAPDIGAYEYGDENYSIPGYQYPQATVPYPADERKDAPYDADLMWLGGLDTVSYKVYLGTSANSLALAVSQTNNIYSPTNLVNDQAYFWRVDCVLADNSVVTGDVWSFTVSDHAPRPHSTRVSLDEDSSLAIELTATDPNGAALTYSVISQPSNGSLSGTAPNLVYTPNENFFGTDSLVYTVNNGTTDSLRGIVMFDVTGTEDSPTFSLATNSIATASTSGPYSGSLGTLATDPDGDALSFTVLSGPSWLTSTADGTLSGTPQLADLGTNSWTIQVTDSTGRSDTATLEMRVVEGSVLPLSFADLGTSLDANALTAEGSATDLTVTGAADGNDYLYSVIYSGTDYDGDSANDTLTFDVRVKGWSGSSTDVGIATDGSTNTASATIGTTSASVVFSGARFVVGDSKMNTTESLEFLTENMAVSLTDTQNSGNVFSSGFTSARLEQTSSTGNSHRAIFGSGTELLGMGFATNQESGTLNVGSGSLYISSDEGGGTRSTSWGVANVDFDLEVEVVPSGSYTQWAASYNLGEDGPLVDSDGDGISNLEEYQNGYNPSVNSTPVFSESSYTAADATAGLAYSSTIDGSAADLEGNALTYSKQSGPAWLTVSSSGDLSGTPFAGDLSLNTWTVEVSDGNSSTTATLEITVNMNQGVVAQWAMNDTSGTVVTDVTGNAFDGTSVDCSSMTGVDGDALLFNGTSSRVTLPVEAFASISDQVSISMWAYGNTDLPKSNSVFYAVDASGNRLLNIHLPWGNSRVYWDAGHDNTSYDRIFKTASAAEYKEAWNHWVFTKNATTGDMKIYLNGALWHSGTGKSKLIGTVNTAAIGAQVSGFSYSGVLDDVLLMNIELSDEEVLDLYLSY